LHNASTHADATHVSLRLQREATSWRLEVHDDGRGLPQSDEPSSSEGRLDGLGLESMRRRAEQIGARLTVAAVEPRGTRVTVVFQPNGRPVRA